MKHLRTDPTVSRRMASTKGRDNERERGLRSQLHRLGLRFRIHYPVPGNRRRSMDIAFSGRRVAVFLDGCFWHGCPQHGTMPIRNREWWLAKLAVNRARDADTDALLAAAGCSVVRIWDHEPLDVACRMVVSALGMPR